MGNRVAEMKECGTEHVQWIVFQSTGMACFDPIFGNQLAATIFASSLHDIYPNWDAASQSRLEGRVNAFVRVTLGENPEEHELYFDYLNDQGQFEELLHQFRNYNTVPLPSRK